MCWFIMTSLKKKNKELAFLKMFLHCQHFTTATSILSFLDPSNLDYHLLEVSRNTD